MKRSLALLLLFIPAVPVTGRDIYVDNVLGDDVRDGVCAEVTGRTGGPCRSIKRALRLAEPGDRIVLARTNQPYRESVTLQAARHSGSSQQPFELIGNGAVLDGTQPISRDAWEHVHGNVYRFQPARMSYQVLYLGGVPSPRVPVVPGEGLPSLQPLEWCLYDRHMYFHVEPGKVPREYDLACAHLTVGITLYDVRNVVVSDLILQGFQLDGLNAHDNVFHATVRGLTARGNGRSGISIGGASRVLLDACLVGDNGSAQVRTEGFCQAQLVNCSLLDNTAPPLVREGGQVSFLDAAGPD